MKSYATTIAAVLALAVGGSAYAQSSSVDKSFTASGATNCAEIVWSPETLAKYPKIAVACKEVMQRDGKTYVKFEGEIKKVSKGGEQVAVSFKEGADPITLTPRAGASVYIDGKKTPVSKLRPGDSLTFYVPEDRLTANTYADNSATAIPEEVPIAPPVEEQVAMAPAEDYSDLPRTAGTLPLFGLLSAMLIALGAGLTARRWMRGL